MFFAVNRLSVSIQSMFFLPSVPNYANFTWLQLHMTSHMARLSWDLLYISLLGSIHSPSIVTVWGWPVHPQVSPTPSCFISFTYWPLVKSVTLLSSVTCYPVICYPYLHNCPIRYLYSLLTPHCCCTLYGRLGPSASNIHPWPDYARKGISNIIC